MTYLKLFCRIVWTGRCQRALRALCSQACAARSPPGLDVGGAARVGSDLVELLHHRGVEAGEVRAQRELVEAVQQLRRPANLGTSDEELCMTPSLSR